MSLAFGNRKESDRNNCVTVSSSHAVIEVSQGHVYRVEFSVPRSNRDSGLVCAEDYRTKHRPVCVGVFSDLILEMGNVRLKVPQQSDNVQPVSMPNSLTIDCSSDEHRFV